METSGVTPGLLGDSYICVVNLGAGHSPIVSTAGCQPPCALRYHVGLSSTNIVFTGPTFGFEK